MCTRYRMKFLLIKLARRQPEPLLQEKEVGSKNGIYEVKYTPVRWISTVRCIQSALYILGGTVRSQMYLILLEQVPSFHIPERFGFPSTGSAYMNIWIYEYIKVWFTYNRIGIYEETFSKSVPVLATFPGNPGKEGDKISVGGASSITLPQHTCQNISFIELKVILPVWNMFVK